MPVECVIISVLDG